MKKQLLTSAAVMLCAGAVTFQASAKGDLSGYFRVQNVASEKYVEVRGPFTAEPDLTFEQASTSAGTVLFVDADWKYKNGAALLRLNHLRGQGVEVIGEPIEDYMGTLTDILLTEEGFDNMNDALWALVRGGFEHGYTSIGRALVQTVIYIVAARLDSENVADKATVDELAQFADRFNKEVAANIDLGIYLEPMDGGYYRLLFETPNLQCVSDWYLKDENKDIFERGFQAMRQYMGGKTGFTGEGLDPDEIAEMQSWGYDPTEKHHTIVDGYLLYVPYEEIFADPDLLFNWLKLNAIKFTDPQRCPQIDLQGIWLPGIAEELQNHHLTQLIISYLPRLQQNQRIYLTDGKNNNWGHFDFTSLQGANDLGFASQWRLCEITQEDDAYLGFKYQGKDNDGFYASVYTDFPMKDDTNDDTTMLYVLSDETRFASVKGNPDLKYEYHVLVKTGEVDRMQPVLIEMTTADPSNHRILIDYEISYPGNAPAYSEDLDVDKWAAPRRRVEEANDIDNTFKGVLFSTVASVDEMKTKWGIDIENDPVNLLTTVYSSTKQPVLWYNPVSDGTQVPANTAFLVKANEEPPVGTELGKEGFAVKYVENPEEDIVMDPIDDTITGVDNITVEGAQNDNRIYNLNGVEVNKVVRGNIYIINGQKVIVK